MPKKKTEELKISVEHLIGVLGSDLETFNHPIPRVNYYTDGLTVTFEHKKQTFQINVKEITIED